MHPYRWWLFCMFWKQIDIFRINVKKAKSPLQVGIAKNMLMSYNEAIEGLSIEIEGVQYVLPVLWATINPPIFKWYILHVHRP